jgi:hypothetical protein
MSLRAAVPTRYGQQRTATGPSRRGPSVYRPRKHRVRAISALEQLSCQTTAMIHFTTPSPPPLPLSRTVCFRPRLLHDDRRWSSPKSQPLARPRGRPGHPSPQKLSHPEAAANAGDLVHRRHHRALGCCSARWPSHSRCTAYTAYPPPSNLCSWPGRSQITGRLLSLSPSLAVSWVPLLPDGAARWHSQSPANNTACGGEERRMGVLHRTFAQPETRTNVSSPSRTRLSPAHPTRDVIARPAGVTALQP